MKPKALGCISLAIATFAMTSLLPALAGKSTSGEKSNRSPNPGTQTAGGITKFKAIDATDSPCTSSTSFVNMPGMSVNIKKTTATPVIAMFQGEWLSEPGVPLIRLVVNGTPQPGPGESGAPFALVPVNTNETAGFNFISAKIPAGSRNVRIQWASSNGSQVCVDERSLVVLFD